MKFQSLLQRQFTNIFPRLILLISIAAKFLEFEDQAACTQVSSDRTAKHLKANPLDTNQKSNLKLIIKYYQPAFIIYNLNHM